MDGVLWFLVFAALAAGVCGVAMIVASFMPSLAAKIEPIVAGQELWLGFGCAVGMMMGSLYMSQVKDFIPCQFCWYQRICAYPIVVVLIVAALRKDYRSFLVSSILAGIGACFSLYHIGIERVDWFEKSTACDINASCSLRWIEVGGARGAWYNITIPVMALCGFLFIIGIGRLGSRAHQVEV